MTDNVGINNNTSTNSSILEEEFNLDSPEETSKNVQEIKEMRQALLNTIGDSNRDPDDILYVNINRANDLLDIVQNDINTSEKPNARLFEVAAQLVNAITSAATSVQNSGFGMMKHEYNMKIADIKEKEVAVKAAIAQGKGSTGSTDEKVLVMTREQLLGIIGDEQTEVEVQSVGE